MPQKRPSTSYTQTLHLIWWKAQLGDSRLADLTPACLVEYRDRLAQGHAPATVNRYLQTLSAVLTVAEQELRWMDENPLRKVRKQKEPRGRVRFLSDDERTRLLNACERSRNRSLYPIVVLALSTGARQGELLALQWADVDLKRGMLTFRETKNGETRAVPLTGQALTLMQHHAKIRRLDTLLVFPDPSGSRPVYIRDAWEYAVERADIQDFRFHDLRHSAASYLAMNGASLLEIAEILGHKTLSMVKRYAHLSESHTRNVVARMNAAVFGG
jgi:integrase